MNTPQEDHGEHQRREGMGGRVRRFLDTKSSRDLDKENQEVTTPADHQADPDRADRDSAMDAPTTLLRPRKASALTGPNRRATQSHRPPMPADPATPNDRRLPHPRMPDANPGWRPLGRRTPAASLAISSLPRAVQRGSVYSTTSPACAKSGNKYRAPLSTIRSARCARPAC